jgi:dynein heavy chain
LLDDILSLQPVKTTTGGLSQEERTLNEVEKIKEKIPPSIDIHALKFRFRNDDNPLNVVLIQEIQRYNTLLDAITKSLISLARGIRGEEVISPSLEAMMKDFADNKVPKEWTFAYFSLKPLASWITDLGERYNFFQQWVQMGFPFVYWISAFTYPTGFTTSLLQRFSRKSTSGNASIDRLEFDFQPDRRAVEEIMSEVKEGAYIRGFYLEGAKWNMEKLHLCEPEVMELHVPMPVIWFKPIIKRTKAQANIYECPCYYYPRRQGDVTKASYMMRIDLKLGPEQTSEHWIKRGTALLMSLDH